MFVQWSCGCVGLKLRNRCIVMDSCNEVHTKTKIKQEVLISSDLHNYPYIPLTIQKAEIYTDRFCELLETCIGGI